MDSGLETISSAPGSLLRQNVCFVLVRPAFLGNIGSTARVMKNFGFRNLRFVQPPKGYKDSEARRMSVDAFDILKEAQVFDTISDALKDINMAIGTTSAQQRALQPIALDEIAPRIVSSAQSEKVALIFGDERNGLLKSELELCHHIITVPTDPEFSSLNLSQAIGICAYELARLQRSAELSTVDVNAPSAGPSISVATPTGAHDDDLMERLDFILDDVGFTKKFNRSNIMTEMRTLYQRAQPNMREYDLLKGALHKISDKIKSNEFKGV